MRCVWIATALLAATSVTRAEGDAARGEKRFESVDALIEQMGRDVEEARAIAL